MKIKKLVFSLFIVVALVQLYIPAQMVWHQQDLLNNGTEFQFEIAPIDPLDPFRGKYIRLNYKENSVRVLNTSNWERSQDVCVMLKKDNTNGFAKIKSVSKNRPETKQNYIRAKVGYINYRDSTTLNIDYPFERYYMEESLAGDAERMTWGISGDSTQTAAAVMRIKKGEAALKTVLVNGEPIEAMVRKYQKRENSGEKEK
jgi:uncharacterized membrane-anchored protein